MNTKYYWCLVLPSCKVLAGSKGGDKYLVCLIQHTKYCKEVTFEWRKVNVVVIEMSKALDKLWGNNQYQFETSKY